MEFRSVVAAAAMCFLSLPYNLQAQTLEMTVPAKSATPSIEDDMGLLDGISGRARLYRATRPVGMGPVVTYAGWLAPNGVTGGSYQNSLSVSTPVYGNETELVTVSVNGGVLHLPALGPLPTSGANVPSDLGRLDIGTRYTQRLQETKAWGGGLTFGSASDRPLASASVDTYSADAFYSLGTSAQSTWVFSLLYSNNNPISNVIPLPGFIYIYRTEHFVGSFGLPFAALNWRPREPWIFSLTVFGPTLNAEVGYGHRRNLQGFVGYRNLEQSFLRYDRADSKDRVREIEQRVYLGARFPVLQELSADVQSGYAFNRSISENSNGHVFRLSRPDNSIDLGSSWYVAANLRLGF